MIKQNQLTHIITKIPGPRSKSQANILQRYESPGLTPVHSLPPIIWEKAKGANVQDIDGNIYIDLTAGFGVVNIGYQNPNLIRVLKDQASHLIHALGDIYPSQAKIDLLKALGHLIPHQVSQTILANSGSEAVEIALKTTMLHTGKPGLIAFEGAYHGLTYGALGLTSHPYFRKPFKSQISTHHIHLPFPGVYPKNLSNEECLHQIKNILNGSSGNPIGGIIIEPIQGRGGIHEAPTSFLKALKKICHQYHLILIFDEIYTGFGRTGKFFAYEHSGVVPDLFCIGKALSSGFPISACIGRKNIMRIWDHDEALHTSTFQGHPIGCRISLESIKILKKKKLAERAHKLGKTLIAQLQQLKNKYSEILEIRGKGLMVGVEIIDQKGKPDPVKTLNIIHQALQRGVILLADGPHQNVIIFTPPLAITQKQLDFTLHVLEQCLKSC